MPALVLCICSTGTLYLQHPALEREFPTYTKSRLVAYTQLPLFFPSCPTEWQESKRKEGMCINVGLQLTEFGHYALPGQSESSCYASQPPDPPNPIIGWLNARTLVGRRGYAICQTAEDTINLSLGRCQGPVYILQRKCKGPRDGHRSIWWLKPRTYILKFCLFSRTHFDRCSFLCSTKDGH